MDEPSHFTLSGYFDVGLLKYLCFVLLLCLYLLIIGANLLLILVICVNRTLHEPMYLFLLSLFVNELYGSSCMFPLLLVQVLSDSHTVSVPLCLLQIYLLYSYSGVELFNLAAMSYDRYVAICCPLHYHRAMTSRRAVVLIALAWLLPVPLCVIMVCMSSSLQLCGNIIHKVYCDNYLVVRLSCHDTRPINVYGLLLNSTVISTTVVLIFYSYSRIISVCVWSSAETRQKALSTCSPQMASLINFTCGSSFELLSSRFDLDGIPEVLRVLLSLYWLLCQPLFNPCMYGLKMSRSCISILVWTVH
uniref:Olfactory receptor n=1 Tax=Salarias fasciatus TaxID=181472 RepID=A0A672GL01_SALFA